MAVTRLASFADLLAYLVENKVPHEHDAQTQVVAVPVTLAPLEGSLYIRWEKKLPYVQLIHPFVTDVPAERRRDVEAAVCLANNAVSLPGLGFDAARRVVYMRLCVPMYEEGMLVTSFTRQVAGVLNNARDFVAAFRDIAGGKPGDEVMALAGQHAAARAASDGGAPAP